MTDTETLRRQARELTRRRNKHQKQGDKLNEEVKTLCTTMYAAGISIAEQAEILGVSRQHVDRWWVDKEAAGKLPEES